jgi:hypothetical protein
MQPSTGTPLHLLEFNFLTATPNTKLNVLSVPVGFEVAHITLPNALVTATMKTNGFQLKNFPIALNSWSISITQWTARPQVGGDCRYNGPYTLMTLPNDRHNRPYSLIHIRRSVFIRIYVAPLLLLPYCCISLY